MGIWSGRTTLPYSRFEPNGDTVSAESLIKGSCQIFWRKSTTNPERPVGVFLSGGDRGRLRWGEATACAEGSANTSVLFVLPRPKGEVVI
ncbi:hypothetical protein QE152_g36874 [Popillia japonica]|uniref:Uncharacterized protein n=1 Tax=Popillia japonica TaxID=7064 RepID=A0AAW1IC61_POPJA